MALEPQRKRVVAFVDGQNLYHAAKEAFGYHYPNYDVRKLAENICYKQHWDLVKIKFYTGIPDARDWGYIVDDGYRYHCGKERVHCRSDTRRPLRQ